MTQKISLDLLLLCFIYICSFARFYICLFLVFRHICTPLCVWACVCWGNSVWRFFCFFYLFFERLQMAERQVSQLASLTTQQHHHTGGARQPNTHTHTHTFSHTQHSSWLRCSVNITTIMLWCVSHSVNKPSRARRCRRRGYEIDFTICNDVGNDDKWSSNFSVLSRQHTALCVPIVWPIMHVSYDPENRHNGQIWIDLLVYSFIFKEPKIFQRASLMFIIILMKSKSSQKRRERQEDGKSKHNNNVYLSFSPHPSSALSIPLFLSHIISFAQCWIAEY